MRIKNLLMEDWLADNQFVEYNLAESGFVDFSLGEFLELCNEDIRNLEIINWRNPDTRGSIELREEILKCYEKAKVENVLVTVGVTEALFIFFNTILEPGDEVIVAFPAFQTLYELPSAIGCKINFLKLSYDNGFTFQPEEVKHMISSKTKLIIVNNPHNPTGSLVEFEDIVKICEIAKKNNIYLLFDEHYKFLPLTRGIEPLLSGFDICKDFYSKVAATGSITKCFGLNGLRVGWLLAEPYLIEPCREFKHYLTHVTPPICDYLAVIALRNKDKLIHYVKDNVLNNVKHLNLFMEKHNHTFDYIEPKGGLVCFPGLKAESNADVFCSKMLNQYNVSLLPGSTFGMNKHFRINFGVKSGKFFEALELMENL